MTTKPSSPCIIAAAANYGRLTTKQVPRVGLSSPTSVHAKYVEKGDAQTILHAMMEFIAGPIQVGKSVCKDSW